MLPHSLGKLLFLGAISVWGAPVLFGSDAQAESYFEKDVRPILKAMCFHCHGEESEKSGGLDLRLVRTIAQGGESGPGIVRGDSANSLLWKRIAEDTMPAGDKKLSANQKEVLRKWIDAGAATARPEPDNPESSRYTDEEMNFWAFVPPRLAALPESEYPSAAFQQNAIDAFIHQRLSSQQRDFSPEADRATLIRRLTIDLTGLPPTPDEVTQFVSDPMPDAYQRLVDRLLASPQMGVRWGRHWLDVAGFSESDGDPTKDRHRPHAWRYRDYVVDALNADLPYDQFLLEQIAGDRLIQERSPPIDGSQIKYDSNDDEQARLLTATGFLQMAPDTTESNDTLTERNQTVSESMQVFGTAVLGLTVGCAQCHDHRYDPISVDDYYRLRAVFDPAMPLHQWRKPSDRLVDMTTDEDRKVADEIEAKAVQLDAELKRRKEEVGRSIQEREIAKAPEPVRDALREAIGLESSKQSEEQKSLLKKYPTVRSVAAVIGQLIEFDKENYRKFEAEEKEIGTLRATKPAPRKIMAARDYVASVKSQVFFRGDPAQPRREVSASEIFVLDRPGSSRETSPVLDRLSYARRLINGQHPLVARVLVNRLWQHHFGRAIVATPNDFGVFGQRPSHPELLDRLACDLVAGDWSMKKMHRAMVLSRTYLQSSTRTAESERLDPDNRWFGRMNVRRLEAEAIRDSILAVTGHHQWQLGGASVPVTYDGSGKAVIGSRKTKDGLFAGVDAVGDQEYRRSLYVEVRRFSPLNFLETFDLPVMNPSCHVRKSSTVAPQSLWLLNDSIMIRYTEQMAERLWSEAHSDMDARLAALHLRLFGQTISQDQQRQYADYLQRQADRFRADPDEAWQKVIRQREHAPQVRALATLCQALLSSNRFLYVD
jgi:hypothetical protein